MNRFWLNAIMLTCTSLLLASPGYSKIIGACPVLVSTHDQWLMASSQYNVVMRVTITAEPSGDYLNVFGIRNDTYPAAQNGTDIVSGSVKLWYVAADTGSLNTTTAQLVTTLTYDSDSTVWYDLSLNQQVDDGSALYVTADITATPANGAICAFYIPQNSTVFSSGRQEPNADLPQFPSSPPTAYTYISNLRAAVGAQAYHQPAALTLVSTGQNVFPLDIILQNLISATPPDYAHIFLSGITITVKDRNNNTLAPDTALSEIGLIDPNRNPWEQQIALVTTMPSTATGIYLPLSLTIPASDQRLRVYAKISTTIGTVVPEFKLSLETSAAILACDEYTQLTVPVLAAPGDNFAMQSNLLTVNISATDLDVYHTQTLAANSVVLRSQTNVTPMTISFNNPGNARTSRIDVTRVTLAVTDSLGNTLSPASIFSRVAITGGVLYGETSSLPTTGSLISIPLSSSYVSVPVYQPVTAIVQADIKPDASAVEFKLSLAGSAAIQAQDSNTTQSVNIRALSGTDPFPMTSAVIRIASCFNLSSRSVVPQTLYPNQRIGILELSFNHPGPADIGPLEIQGVTLTARNQDGQLLPFSGVCRTIYIADATQGTLFGQATPSQNQSSLFIPISGASLLPSSSLTLLVELATSDTFAGNTFSLEISTNTMLQVYQPTDPTRPVFVAGSWPMKSRVASLGGGNGELLLSNYPNPFAAGKESTRIAFYLKNSANVTITLYTVAGDLVNKVASGKFFSAGGHEVDWDGRTTSGGIIKNGVYLLRIEAVPVAQGEPVTQIRKVAVIK